MGQDNRVEELEIKIEDLKNQLAHARTKTYVGETHTLSCTNGELYIGYDNWGEDCTLVMDVNQLFRDLPSIIDMVCKEAKKEHKAHLKMIREAQDENGK